MIYKIGNLWNSASLSNSQSLMNCYFSKLNRFGNLMILKIVKFGKFSKISNWKFWKFSDLFKTFEIEHFWDFTNSNFWKIF